jgi:addiction module HigA family antidote
VAQMIPLEHPGVILLEEFIEPFGLSTYAVSKATGISQTALGEIIKGKRGISPTNGLRLAKYFGLSDEYFVKLQMQFEIDTARQKDQKSLSKIIKFDPKRNKPSGCVEQLEA